VEIDESSMPERDWKPTIDGSPERRWPVFHCPSRREFLRQTSGLALAAGLSAAEQARPVRGVRRSGMLYRRLGQADLHVSVLSFGSHTDPKFKKPLKDHSVLTDEGQARRDRQLSRAFDLGVNMVDTYESDGQWEPVARLVRPKRDKVLVSICR